MLDVSIELAVSYVKDAPFCKIVCNESTIYHDVLSDNKKFDFTVDGENLDILVRKQGLSKNNHQQILIKKLEVNGIQMDIDNFGKFFVEWNNGVANHWLKTTSCDYNGTWHFNIKTPYRLIGIDNLQHDKLKENMQDCDVACFGDSATYGQFLKDSETWPAVLKSKTGLDVRNYGVYSSSGMSNFNQIFAIMEKFLLTYKAKHIFVLLPPSFKKQIKINGNIVNAGEWHPDTYHYFCNNESHQLALIISQIDDFLNQHHNKSNIYFSTTYNNDNLLFRRSKLSRYFLDFVDPDQYDKLDSIRKHFDQKYCLDFAENLCKIIKYT